MSDKVEFKRLPLNVLPVNYAVTLKPNFNDFTFDGNVVIDLEVGYFCFFFFFCLFNILFLFKSKVKESVDNILLNSIELEFNAATYEYADACKYFCECFFFFFLNLYF